MTACTQSTTERKDSYADVPPDGYTLGSNRLPIGASDLVYFRGTSTRDAEWTRPERGANIIGATVHDHWPEIMAVAVKR